MFATHNLLLRQTRASCSRIDNTDAKCARFVRPNSGERNLWRRSIETRIRLDDSGELYCDPKPDEQFFHDTQYR